PGCAARKLTLIMARYTGSGDGRRRSVGERGKAEGTAAAPQLCPAGALVVHRNGSLVLADPGAGVADPPGLWRAGGPGTAPERPPVSDRRAGILCRQPD